MLELSDDQELLRQTTERFITSTFPLSAVRERADKGAPLPSTYVAQAAELGWFAFLVPEQHGGGSISEQGILDAVVVADEHGRGLQPGPLIPVNVVADTLARHGSPEQQKTVLPALASGEATAAWAVASTAGEWDPTHGLTAQKRAEGFTLSGAKGLVQEGDTARWVLATAATDAGPTMFLIDTSTAGMVARPLDGLDLTRRLCEIRFDDVEVPASAVVGTIGGAAAAYDRQLCVAIALALSEMVGAMDRLFTMTVEYAKDRTAFGRPIGSFQAIKHLLADTSLLLEASKGALTGVVKAVAKDGPDAAEVVSMGKAYVSEAAITLSQNCWQSFGGIAYTWEHDFHLFMRRLTADSLLYGDAAWHRERICQIHDL